MTIDDQIENEKLQYDINREATKISALSSGKTGKYDYLIEEDILPFNQKQIIEQAKFTYSPLGKAFEKKAKTIEDQEKKQVDPLESLKPKELKAIKHDKFDDNEKSLIYKEIFEEISNERISEIHTMSKNVGFNNFT